MAKRFRKPPRGRGAKPPTTAKKSGRKFVLGVDLDGVCADFYAGLRPIAAEWLEVPIDKLPTTVTWGLPEWGIDKVPGGYDALHRFAVTQRDLFARLSPLPDAAPALRRLSDRDVRIRIITHRLVIKYFHQEAVRQTIEWLDRYDIPYWDLCFMKDKAAVGADLYVEDSRENVAALRAQRCATICFANTTNEGVRAPRADNWRDAEKQIITAMKGWKRRLATRARARRDKRRRR